MSARILAVAAGFLALVTLPYWMPGVYYLNVSSQILYYAVFALGLNILAGYGGLVSLGHAGLFGIAAYTVGYMLQADFGHPAAIIGALVIGFIYNFGQALLPELSYFVLFLPMLVVLLVRPQGLFGEKIIERV